MARIPPDLSQCQALRPNGHGPFTLCGRPGHVRCSEKPTVIATETEADPDDGERGSMSLCNHCSAVMIAQLGEEHATLRQISDEDT